MKGYCRTRSCTAYNKAQDMELAQGKCAVCEKGLGLRKAPDSKPIIKKTSGTPKVCLNKGCDDYKQKLTTLSSLCKTCGKSG